MWSSLEINPYSKINLLFPSVSSLIWHLDWTKGMTQNWWLAVPRPSFRKCHLMDKWLCTVNTIRHACSCIQTQFKTLNEEIKTSDMYRFICDWSVLVSRGNPGSTKSWKIFNIAHALLDTCLAMSLQCDEKPPCEERLLTLKFLR